MSTFTSVNKTKLQIAFAMAHRLSEDLTIAAKERRRYRAIATLIWEAHGELGTPPKGSGKALVTKMDLGILAQDEQVSPGAHLDDFGKQFVRLQLLPDGLLDALERRRGRLKYTDPKTVYHCIQPDYRNSSVGVVGDGLNASYEWFIWNPATKTLRTSDCGYGSDGIALCCGLVESRASSNWGDHDVILTWTPEQGL